MTSSLLYGKSLISHKVTSLECSNFLCVICVTGVTPVNMAKKLLYFLVILALADDIGPKYLDQIGFRPDCQYGPLEEN